MSNYHFFGCSWTAWSKTNYVEELAKLTPEHNFYNWAQSGSSIALSTYLLDAVKHRYTGDNNYFIFQATNPYRVSWWNTIDFRSINQLQPNYFKLPALDGKYWQGFSAANCKDKAFGKYHKQYYMTNTNTNMNHEYKTYCKFAKDNSDYIFWQQKQQNKVFDNMICVQDLLGEEKHNKYLSRDGWHFARPGSKWQAQWIKKELKIGI